MSGSPSATAHVEPLLAAYHAGALPPDDVARVAAHLRGCAACRERSEQIAIDQIIRATPAPTVGPELRQRLYARIAEAEMAAAQQSRGSSRASLAARHASHAGERTHSHGVSRGGWLSGAAAALLVSLLVSVFWALPHMRPVGKRGAHHTTPTTACPASKTTADLPANLSLEDLAMTSATDGWAVGAMNGGNGRPSQGVIMRYSDCHWSQVALVLKDVNLTHISMDSPTDGWAAGQLNYGRANSNIQGIVLLHYTGDAWSVVPASQRPANNGSVLALSMRAPDDGWIVTIGPDTIPYGSMLSVETYRMWHYQQGAWTLVTPCPIMFPEIIAPAGPDDLWAAGSSFTGSGKEQAQYLAHYHDGAWTQIASPDVLQVWSMRAVSPTDIWISGAVNDGSGYNVVEHYDGVTWRLAPDAVPTLPTPALTPGATPTPTEQYGPPPQPGEFNGIVTITGDGAGWAYDWKPDLITTPGSQAMIGSVYREDGGQWQALNWPYSNISFITSWAPFPDGEVWAIGIYWVDGTPTPHPGGGASNTAVGHGVLLHYTSGVWTRYG
jgi:hypothetical protein